MAKYIPLPMQTLEPTEYYTKSEVNDLIADFITNTVDDLVNYYTKTETDNIISSIESFKYEVYASLQDITTPATNVLYLIGPDSSATGDLYEEYVYDGSDFVKIGDTSIDLSDYVTTSDLNTALADYTPTTSLATVATSGAYSDLTGTPTLATVATSGAYSDLSGTPSLATVATTGAYSDLTGTPTLATVATSGSYADLTNTPTIPTVNDSTITITQGGVTKGSFTLNQGTDATIDVDAGGGGGDKWFGTQAQFEAVANKDANTDYYISDIYYSELKGRPDLSKYDTITDVNSKVKTVSDEVVKKTEIQFMTAQEYSQITPREGKTYAIEGQTVQLTFTLADDSTVTYNFVID